MKTLIYFIIAVVLTGLLFVDLKPAEAAKPADEPRVQILFQCGSLIGDGDIFIMVDGEIEHHTVHCGGPAV